MGAKVSRVGQIRLDSTNQDSDQLLAHERIADIAFGGQATGPVAANDEEAFSQEDVRRSILAVLSHKSIGSTPESVCRACESTL